jgi:hypothetical protein
VIDKKIVRILKKPGNRARVEYFGFVDSMRLAKNPHSITPSAQYFIHSESIVADGVAGC